MSLLLVLGMNWAADLFWGIWMSFFLSIIVITLVSLVTKSREIHLIIAINSILLVIYGLWFVTLCAFLSIFIIFSGIEFDPYTTILAWIALVTIGFVVFFAYRIIKRALGDIDTELNKHEVLL